MLSALTKPLTAIQQALFPKPLDGEIRDKVTGAKLPARAGISGAIGADLVAPAAFHTCSPFLGLDVVNFSFRGQVDGENIFRSLPPVALHRFIQDMREQIRTEGKVTRVPDVSSIES